MKAQEIRCRICNGEGVLHGSDDCDTEGPWYVACEGCGYETVVYAYAREAWKAWKWLHEKRHTDERCGRRSRSAPVTVSPGTTGK